MGNGPHTPTQFFIVPPGPWLSTALSFWGKTLFGQCLCPAGSTNGYPRIVGAIQNDRMPRSNQRFSSIPSRVSKKKTPSHCMLQKPELMSQFELRRLSLFLYCIDTVKHIILVYISVACIIYTSHTPWEGKVIWATCFCLLAEDGEDYPEEDDTVEEETSDADEENNFGRNWHV